MYNNREQKQMYLTVSTLPISTLVEITLNHPQSEIQTNDRDLYRNCQPVRNNIQIFLK
uniref:Uncharacterized protein n=1 Tax=Octopus bimaculoides TaxID=37653 RepID=A0A0L8H5V2_OCTBM